MRLKSVIFDYGGVLCLLPTDEQVSELAKDAGLGTQEFLRWFWHHRLAYDRGDFTNEGYWRAIGNATGKTYTAEQVASFVDQDCRFWLKLDEPMLEWNRTLRKQGYRTAVLSNMPEPLGVYLYQHTRLFEEFDAVTLSYEVRSAKPEAKIYRSCLASLEVRAGDALFLDDKEPNVHAAQATGLHSVVYSSRAKFAGREKIYGLPPIPV